MTHDLFESSISVKIGFMLKCKSRFKVEMDALAQFIT
jgi:hypothetical protein